MIDPVVESSRLVARVLRAAALSAMLVGCSRDQGKRTPPEDSGRATSQQPAAPSAGGRADTLAQADTAVAGRQGCSLDLLADPPRRCVGVVSTNLNSEKTKKDLRDLADSPTDFIGLAEGASAWVPRCVDRPTPTRPCETVLQRIEVNRAEPDGADFNALAGYVIGRIIVQPGAKPDLRYGLSTRLTVNGQTLELDTTFVIVMHRSNLQGAPVGSGVVRAQFSIFGVTRGAARQAVRIGRALNRFLACTHPHPASGNTRFAYFISCAAFAEVADIAREEDSLEVEDALRFLQFEVQRKLGNSPSAPPPELLARVSPRARERLLKVRFDPFTDPGWMRCPVGCCTADGEM